MDPTLLPLLLLAAILVTASLIDLRTQRIPNALSLGGAGLGVALGFLIGGMPGVFAALGGLAVGFAAFLPVYALGGLGAGDVKLMAAAGSLLGSPLAGVHAVLYTALAGAVLSLGYWIAREGWQVVLAEALQLLRRRRGEALAASGLRMPYALAITTGSLVAALTPPLIGG